LTNCSGVSRVTTQALSEADAVRHSFADESKLTVREYITKKTQLYQEAGEEQEDLIVKRMHEGLDPTLALASRQIAQTSTDR
jgi:hypothetical protein